MKKVRCGNCKKYIHKSTATRRGISYFCDNNCYYDKKNSQFKSKPETNRREVDLGPRKASPKKRVKNNVFKKDGFRCRYCGRSGDLITHHVIYRSEIRNRQYQDYDANLISLCNEPCHLSVVHSNKKKYQPLCLKIIWLREINGNTHTLIKDLEKEDNE